MTDIIVLIISSFWSVLGQMAPYLLFGYLIAGILSILVTTDFVQKHLGENSFTAIFKAALLGMPLPLCSCSVIPVSASLRRHGAGRGAVASFLISTPTTGVDSIMAAWAILGPVFALYRAVISVVLGIMTGMFVIAFSADEDTGVQPAKEGEVCCSLHSKEEAGKGALRRILGYAFITLPRDLTRPLLIGIVIASVISAFIQVGVIEQFLGAGIWTMLLMLVVGIPLYVCATASIPFALGFMALGASPGAALVFLIVGPATNAATLTVLWKLIGKRATTIMLCCIVIGSLVSGFMLDYLWPESLVVRGIHTNADDNSMSWFYAVSAVCFLMVQFWSVYCTSVLSLITGKKIAPVSCCGTGHDHAEHIHSHEMDVSAGSCCDSADKAGGACCSGGSSKDDDCCSKGQK